MGNQGNSSEEDYLDSLLKSVTSSGKDEKLNNIISDEEFLGDIEKDLFGDDTDEINEFLNLDEEFDDILETSDLEENVNDILETPVKKPKKGLFSRKEKASKKREHVPEAEVVVKEPEERQESEEPEEIEEIQLEEKLDAQLEEQQEDILGLFEGMEDLFSDQPEVSEESSNQMLEPQMDELYDILGVVSNEDKQENQNVEIEKLEEQKKPKKEKRSRREKKAKKAKLSESDLPVSDDMTGLFDSPGLSSIFDGQESEGFKETNEMEELGNLFSGGFEEEQIKDENDRLIEEMDSGKFDEEEILTDVKEDKKKKKVKKPKKEKKPKVKKVKPAKPVKEKKPRDPELDEVIHISKAFIIFSISLIVLIVFVLNMGGKYYNYNKKTDAAVAYYLNQNYAAAYDQLIGLTMHEDDQFFYDQVETIMYVNRHYVSAKSLIKLEEYTDGLQTLLRGIVMYDKYKDIARDELHCYDEMANVLSLIDGILLDTYGLSESEAREIVLMEDQFAYAKKVNEIASKAKAKADAQKEAEKEAQKEAQKEE